MRNDKSIVYLPRQHRLFEVRRLEYEGFEAV